MFFAVARHKATHLTSDGSTSVIHGSCSSFILRLTRCVVPIDSMRPNRFQPAGAAHGGLIHTSGTLLFIALLPMVLFESTHLIPRDSASKMAIAFFPNDDTPDVRRSLRNPSADSQRKDDTKIQGTDGRQNKKPLPPTQNGPNGSNSDPRSSRTNTANPQVSNPFPITLQKPEIKQCTRPFPASTTAPCVGKFRSSPSSNFPFRHEPSNRTPPALHSRSTWHQTTGSTRRDPPRCCIFDFRQSGAQIPWGFSANALNS